MAWVGSGILTSNSARTCKSRKDAVGKAEDGRRLQLVLVLAILVVSLLFRCCSSTDSKLCNNTPSAQGRWVMLDEQKCLGWCRCFPKSEKASVKGPN